MTIDSQSRKRLKKRVVTESSSFDVSLFDRKESKDEASEIKLDTPVVIDHSINTGPSDRSRKV